MKYLWIAAFLGVFSIVYINSVESVTPKTDNKLVFVYQKQADDVKVKIGDVLQIVPFKYALTEKFVGAELKYKLTGDRVLEYIGQSAVPEGKDGSGARSIFFYVKENGTTTVTLSLVGTDGKSLGKEDLEYIVKGK